MHATLIEIDTCAPEPHWYARYPGLRLWCFGETQVRGDADWHVLRGQGLAEQQVDFWLSIHAEHAWVVREGEVELRLVECDAGPPEGAS